MNGGKSKSEVYSLFIKEKASEASLRRSLTQAGKERDYAYNEMKKSQTTHQLAVAKHEKLQHEMEQKKLTAELIYDAWKRIDADNNVDFGVCKNKMDGMNDKVDTVGISMQVVDDGNVSVLLGQNNEKTRDTSLPDGVGIHVVVDNGVRHISAEVIETIIDPISGNLSKIKLDNGEIIESDIWFDCTGFNRVLINAELKDPSANKDLNVFGILKATKRASATAEVPRKIAINVSLK